MKGNININNNSNNWVDIEPKIEIKQRMTVLLNCDYNSATDIKSTEKTPPRGSENQKARKK